MSEDVLIKADIWKGYPGLPSIDTECMYFLTYTKLAGVEVRMTPKSPFLTPRGRLPVLKFGDEVLTNFDSLTKVLKSLGKNPDDDLSPEQQSKATAYCSLFREKIYPAFLKIYWKDKKNAGFLKKLYSRDLFFPFKFYYPAKVMSDAEAYVENVLEQSDDDLEKDVSNCLEAVSSQLGDKFWLVGAPSSADALLFAMIAPMVRLPLPGYTPNLAAFEKWVFSITVLLFPNEMPFDEGKHCAEKSTMEKIKEKLSVVAITVGMLCLFQVTRSAVNQMLKWSTTPDLPTRILTAEFGQQEF